MPDRKRPETASPDAASTIFREAMGAAIEHLARAGRTRTGDKPYFFPDGIQLIQLSLKLPSEFALTVSGSAQVVSEASSAKVEQGAFAPAAPEEEVCDAPEDEEHARVSAAPALAVAAPPVNTELTVPAT